MNAVVDTSVWSLALRRTDSQADPVAIELGRLVQEGRALLIGLVRQELLSGVKTPKQFEDLRLHLRAFLDVEIETADHETAASLFNRCRSRGVQGALVDFLICAVALRRGCAVFTTDGDFTHYARILDIPLHQPRAATS